jgi:hypothetical protein
MNFNVTTYKEANIYGLLCEKLQFEVMQLKS